MLKLIKITQAFFTRTGERKSIPQLNFQRFRTFLIGKSQQNNLQMTYSQISHENYLKKLKPLEVQQSQQTKAEEYLQVFQQ